MLLRARFFPSFYSVILGKVACLPTFNVACLPHLMWKDHSCHCCRQHMPSQQKGRRGTKGLSPPASLSLFRKESIFEQPPVDFLLHLIGQHWITYSLLDQPLAKRMNCCTLFEPILRYSLQLMYCSLSIIEVSLGRKMAGMLGSF